MKRVSAHPREAAFSVLIFFFLLLLVKNSSIAMEGVRLGLSLCLDTLLPALFPFLVLSELIVGMGAERLARRLFKPLQALLGLSAAGCTAFLLGALCGFPVATTTALAMQKRGELSTAEARRLFLFSNNPSLGFLVGLVGVGLLQSPRLGLLLFLIVQLSAIAVGVGLRLICTGRHESGNIPQNGMEKPKMIVLFTESVGHAFSALLQVCAFVVFFACIANCLSHAAAALSLPAWPTMVLQGLLELTTGVNAATQMPRAAAFCLCAFFAAFSGLSVCMQLFSLSKENAPALFHYLTAKLVQAAIALFLAMGALRLFPCLLL